MAQKFYKLIPFATAADHRPVKPRGGQQHASPVKKGEPCPRPQQNSRKFPRYTCKQGILSVKDISHQVRSQRIATMPPGGRPAC